VPVGDGVELIEMDAGPVGVPDALSVAESEKAGNDVVGD
jgi:hypothetical protein